MGCIRLLLQKVETFTPFLTEVEAFRHHFNTVSLFTSQHGAYTSIQMLTALLLKNTPQNISEQHSIFHSPTHS